MMPYPRYDIGARGLLLERASGGINSQADPARRLSRQQSTPQSLRACRRGPRGSKIAPDGAAAPVILERFQTTSWALSTAPTAGRRRQRSHEQDPTNTRTSRLSEGHLASERHRVDPDTSRWRAAGSRGNRQLPHVLMDVVEHEANIAVGIPVDAHSITVRPAAEDTAGDGRRHARAVVIVEVQVAVAQRQLQGAPSAILQRQRMRRDDTTIGAGAGECSDGIRRSPSSSPPHSPVEGKLRLRRCRRKAGLLN